jgi:hypothetical protein
MGTVSYHPQSVCLGVRTTCVRPTYVRPPRNGLPSTWRPPGPPNVRSIVGSNNGPNNVFFSFFFHFIESCWTTMGHVCDQPLVDGAQPPTKRKWKLMVSLESFKRIFHCFFSFYGGVLPSTSLIPGPPAPKSPAVL